MNKPALTIGAAGLAGLVLGLTVSACRHDLPDHCANLAGDDTCSSRGQGTFCSGCVLENDGCVDVLPSSECHAASGPMGDESSGTGGTETSSGSGSATDTGSGSAGSTSSGSGSPCMNDGDCPDAAAPYCDPVGECVSCAGMDDPDMACAGTDPGNPLCIDEACVACTAQDTTVCDAELLLCDEGTNTCVACTEHEQCASGACELAAGRCFPADTVLHVDLDGGQDFASVAAAVASISDGMHGVLVVHEAGMDGLTPYTGLVQVDGGKTLAILAAPGELPILQGTGANPGVRVQGARTVVYADGLTVSNGSALGLVVDGATAWLDRTSVVGNDGGGVRGENAADVTLRNCFVGGGAQDVDAVALNGSSLAAVYSTFGGGGVLGGRARALFCEGTSTADVRNSILVSADPMPEVECPGVTLASSATEGDVGNLDIGWFSGYAAGDFTLTASGSNTFEELAQWNDGDPSTDIEGDARPTTDGASDYAGADVP